MFCFISFKGYAVELFRHTDGILRLQYHGHLYVKHTLNKDKMYWRCAQYKKGCRARLSTHYINGRAITYKPDYQIIHQNHDYLKRSTRLSIMK